MMLKKIGRESFSRIYADMESQFPPEELNPEEAFQRLMEEDSGYDVFFAEDISACAGYACCAYDARTGCVLLDYLAVFKNLHSQGCGGRILDAVMARYPHAKALIIETEKEDPSRPDTLRRVNFYRNKGARKLNFGTVLPHASGTVEMDLYALNLRGLGENELEEAVAGALERLYPKIYAHSPHVPEALEAMRSVFAMA